MLIDFNNTKYYRADYVKEINPAFFHGCARSIRYIIDKKKLSVNDYIYATFSSKENKWSKSSKEINKASLLLNEEYVNNNVPGFGTNTKKLDLEITPPLLLLEEHMKFRDENGNIIEIETRGERTMDGIYFYGKDIEKMLQLACIKDVLHNKTSSYTEGKHYKKFIYKGDGNTFTSKIQNQETMYLTYIGLVKLITKTRKYVPVKFTDWLNELIDVPFIHHRFISIETDTIHSIVTALNCDCIKQYIVDKYKIDLYIPEFNIAIECDENNHIDRNVNYEIERETNILKKLNCTFIRYNPNDEYFDIFKVIKDINKEIFRIKDKEKQKQQLLHEYEIKELKSQMKELNSQNEIRELKLQHEIRELKLKLENETLVKNLEKQLKDELISILKGQYSQLKQ